MDSAKNTWLRVIKHKEDLNSTFSEEMKKQFKTKFDLESKMVKKLKEDK